MELRLATMSAVISVTAVALLSGLLVDSDSMTLACSMLSSDMIAVRWKHGVACWNWRDMNSSPINTLSIKLYVTCEKVSGLLHPILRGETA